MNPERLEFGYHPGPLELSSGPISISALPNLTEIVTDMLNSERIENDWVYAPPQESHQFGDDIPVHPYNFRVFSLPKTHFIDHKNSDGDENLKFHIWVLSFLTGMRLTSSELGFIDTTPLNPGRLVDFNLRKFDLEKFIGLAEKFWIDNRGEPHRARLIVAIVHALFLAQNPRHFQFERFLILYTAFDACYALAASLWPPKKKPTHDERIDWMCRLFRMETPLWAEAGKSQISHIRNTAIHEALFIGEPLGFAIHGIGTEQNLPLELEALICRLFVALLGGVDAAYVKTSVGTRQRHFLELP